MKVYFIGIGGIGVSALARKHLAEGHQVSGSDRSASLITEELEKLGAEINLEQKAENITENLDLVIYTIAISPDHPELARACELNLKILSYPEALGELSRSHFTIAISGTHGKTTTTAMVAQILISAGLDPTVIVGSLLQESQSNFIAGKSKFLVVEACEYRRSFLNLSPQILVITNIETDHLDYYRDLDDIKSAFEEMKNKLPENGVLITEREYSKIRTDFKLKVPGAHNVRNAQAALAVAQALGIDYLVAVEALESFSGTWRRFELKGTIQKAHGERGARVYDDYAHHPSEIKATLSGARELVGEGKRIFAVFQPHLYSRTQQLFADFTASFSEADEVIITDIYAAREDAAKFENISGEKLAKSITNTSAKYLPDFLEIAKYLKEKTEAGDFVIIMGAGDISQVASHLL
mgnify:CR=1 FL=1